MCAILTLFGDIFLLTMLSPCTMHSIESISLKHRIGHSG